MIRTPDGWRAVCVDITGGFIPGGDKAKTYDSGMELFHRYIRPHIPFDKGALVVDVGCGNGRLAMALADLSIEYIGIDIVAESISFCRQAFDGYENFRFAHMDVRNGHYNPAGKFKLDEVAFPVPSGCVDVVLCSSLFTHIAPLIFAEYYVQEIKRLLRPQGWLYTTWFRSPPNEPASDEARTVYREHDIIDMLRGFVWRHSEGGLTTGRIDQWRIVCQKLYLP